MFRKAICTLSAAVLCGLSFLAAADTAPEDAADYRKSVMTALRGHIGAISMTVRGLVDDRGHLAHHARALANGVKELPHVFPEGSNVGESEALPVIWEDPEAFAEAIANAESATESFAAAAESGDMDAVRSGFRGVGMACRGCHDRFRVAQD